MKTKEYFSLPPFFLFLISSRKLASYIWSCFEKKKKKEKPTNFYPTESIQITLIIRNSFPNTKLKKLSHAPQYLPLHDWRHSTIFEYKTLVNRIYSISLRNFPNLCINPLRSKRNYRIHRVRETTDSDILFRKKYPFEKFRKDTKRKGSHVSSSLFQINVLLPTYGKRLMGEEMNTLACAAPPEHEGENLTSLFNRSLRCLDLYNARPEKDAMILVGILIGILFAIPVCLTTFIFWRRGFFFCGSSGPASFSRAFYKRTMNDDEFWSFFFLSLYFFSFPRISIRSMTEEIDSYERRVRS